MLLCGYSHMYTSMYVGCIFKYSCPCVLDPLHKLCYWEVVGNTPHLSLDVWDVCYLWVRDIQTSLTQGSPPKVVFITGYYSHYPACYRGNISNPTINVFEYLMDLVSLILFISGMKCSLSHVMWHAMLPMEIVMLMIESAVMTHYWLHWGW